MKKTCVLLLTIFCSYHVYAGSLIEGITKDMDQISKELIKNPAIDQALRKNMVQTLDKINRLELIQSATENALAIRIKQLEKTVAAQNELISEYKVLVEALKSKITE